MLLFYGRRILLRLTYPLPSLVVPPFWSGVSRFRPRRYALLPIGLTCNKYGNLVLGDT